MVWAVLKSPTWLHAKKSYALVVAAAAATAAVAAARW
jgi:hypothetical protein